MTTTDLEQLKQAAQAFSNTKLGYILEQVCQDLERLEQQNLELVKEVRDLQDLVLTK